MQIVRRKEKISFNYIIIMNYLTLISAFILMGNNRNKAAELLKFNYDNIIFCFCQGENINTFSIFLSL